MSDPSTPSFTSDKPLPSPTELGLLLGLSESGWPAVAGSASAEDSSWQGKAGLILETFRSLRGDEAKHQAYQDEFNSLYLPSLIQSALSIDPEVVDNVYIPVALWSTSSVSVRVAPVFARFIREQPDLAMQFYKLLAVRLINFTPSSDQMHLLHEPGWSLKFISKRYHTLAERYADLLTHLPLRVSLPPLPSRARETLQAFRERLDTDERLREAVAGELPDINLRSLGRAITRIVQQDRPILLERLRSARKTSRGILWWTCQAQCDSPKTTSACTEVQEMKACGRCGAVRYCSEEHQLADWKRHKKICFQPTW